LKASIPSKILTTAGSPLDLGARITLDNLS
jgi:hypothetical protein